MQLQSEMQRTFCDIAENQRGELRIGVAYTRGRAILPAIVPEFQAQYPNVRVVLVEETNQALLKLLGDGQIDLAIAHFAKAPPGIVLQPFYTEVTMLLVHDALLRAHGIDLAAHRGEIERGDLRALRDCPFVLGSAEDIVGDLERAAFRRSGFQPVVQAVSSNSETLLALCAEGIGACFCPENLAGSAQGALPLDGVHQLRMPESMRYPISFGYAKSAAAWSVLDAFLRIARAQYPPRT